MEVLMVDQHAHIATRVHVAVRPRSRSTPNTSAEATGYATAWQQTLPCLLFCAERSYLQAHWHQLQRYIWMQPWHTEPLWSLQLVNLNAVYTRTST